VVVTSAVASTPRTRVGTTRSSPRLAPLSCAGRQRLAAANTHLGVDGVSPSGPELRRRYVTTATEHWSDEQRRCEPVAGLVYRCVTEATGLPAAPFRRGWWEDLTR
jgi:hypothetical protein